MQSAAITDSSIGDDAVIIELKVQDGDEETELSDTVEAALKQIREKNYEASPVAGGFRKSVYANMALHSAGKRC